MNGIIERSQRFLDRSLGIGSRALLLVCAVLIFPTGLRPASAVGASAAASWIPFALGLLALLFLRACVQGKVRDLVDVAVVSFYFSVFLYWSPGSGPVFSLPLVASLLLAAALVMAWRRACFDEIADAQSAG